MATFHAIRSVGDSIAEFLNSRYPESLADAGYPASFRLISSGELANEDLSLTNAITLYLYRVSVNEQLRNMRSPGAPDATSPLPLNLHYVMSAWADSAEIEHTIMAWAMRVIHENPILDASSLRPDGEWGPDEVVHIAPEELSNEDLLRLWDAITPSYRLSYTYVARVVVMEAEQLEPGAPVVARRFTYGEER